MKLGIKELVLLALMIGLLGASWFTFQKIDAKRLAEKSEMERKKKVLADLRQTTGSDDLGKKILELKQAISFFESKLPQEREIDKVLNEISKLIEANALQAKTFRTLQSQQAAGYCEQAFEMSLSGDFNGFYAFLLQLEKLPRITRVHNMILTKITDRDGAMQAKLTLSIFFEPENGSSRMATAN